jgi:predicted protein tyrosine phosphatase
MAPGSPKNNRAKKSSSKIRKTDSVRKLGHSLSEQAGLTHMSVARVLSMLKGQGIAERVSPTAAVYLTATMESLSTIVLEMVRQHREMLANDKKLKTKNATICDIWDSMKKMDTKNQDAIDLALAEYMGFVENKCKDENGKLVLCPRSNLKASHAKFKCDINISKKTLQRYKHMFGSKKVGTNEPRTTSQSNESGI